MPKELTQEEIFQNDEDPLAAIAAIRREEGSSEEDLQDIVAEIPETEEEAEPDELDETPDDTGEVKGQVVEEEIEEIEDVETVDKDATKEEITNAPAIKTFTANGKEFSFTEAEILEQFESVFGKAMDYTQKTQKMAPFRKMISALESQNISSEQLNTAIDALKGNKEAIKAMLEKNSIDPYDLIDAEENNNVYNPTQYGKNDIQLDIEEVSRAISSDPEYKITVDVVDNQWDQASRDVLASNPGMIRGLHNDIKNGIYDKVAPVAMKMKVLDGNTKSDIDYYVLAGQQVLGTKDNTSETKNTKTQNAKETFDKASSEANKKRAASSTRTRADSNTVVNYLDDNDDDYDAWYKKITASQ